MTGEGLCSLRPIPRISWYVFVLRSSTEHACGYSFQCPLYPSHCHQASFSMRQLHLHFHFGSWSLVGLSSQYGPRFHSGLKHWLISDHSSFHFTVSCLHRFPMCFLLLYLTIFSGLSVSYAFILLTTAPAMVSLFFSSAGIPVRSASRFLFWFICRLSFLWCIIAYCEFSPELPSSTSS